MKCQNLITGTTTSSSTSSNLVEMRSAEARAFRWRSATVGVGFDVE